MPIAFELAAVVRNLTPSATGPVSGEVTIAGISLGWNKVRVDGWAGTEAITSTQ
jgi:hypothetical protein